MLNITRIQDLQNPASVCDEWEAIWVENTKQGNSKFHEKQSGKKEEESNQTAFL